jgi:type III secretory pathway component EscS
MLIQSYLMESQKFHLTMQKFLLLLLSIEAPSVLNLTVIGLIIGCVLGYLMDRLCDISLNNIKKIHGNDNVWNIKDK